MTKDEFAKQLQQEASPEKMKEWEIKCKREIIEYFTIKTKRPREEIINAIKNTKEHWMHLHQVIQDKSCGHQYGFFECDCEGDMSQCPHSHAYMDIECDINKKTGKLESLRIGAKLCNKYQEIVREAQEEANKRYDRIKQLY